MQGSFEDEGYWLRSWSNETYLWYDEIQDRDPSLYATSSEGVLEYFDLLKTKSTPSTVTIRSPRCKPASAAGESLLTRTMTNSLGGELLMS